MLDAQNHIVNYNMHPRGHLKLARHSPEHHDSLAAGTLHRLSAAEYVQLLQQDRRSSSPARLCAKSAPYSCNAAKVLRLLPVGTPSQRSFDEPARRRRVAHYAMIDVCINDASNMFPGHSCNLANASLHKCTSSAHCIVLPSNCPTCTPNPSRLGM